jgi:hypothetical protein
MGKRIFFIRKSWKENLHPRDGHGRFSFAPDNGQNPPMGNTAVNLNEFKDEIKHTLIDTAVPRMKVGYTEENFKKLFGKWNRVDTPIGGVTVPHSQFIKLEKEKREGWLGAMYQTITDPVVIIQESPERKLYIKTFTPERKGVITFLSVIIEDGNNRVNISNHEKDINNILNKIKKAGDVVYKKPTNTGVDSLTFGKSLRRVLSAGGNYGDQPLAIKGINHLSIISQESLKKSSPRLIIKMSTAIALMKRLGGYS